MPSIPEQSQAVKPEVQSEAPKRPRGRPSRFENNPDLKTEVLSAFKRGQTTSEVKAWLEGRGVQVTLRFLQQLVRQAGIRVVVKRGRKPKPLTPMNIKAKIQMAQWRFDRKKEKLVDQESQALDRMVEALEPIQEKPWLLTDFEARLRAQAPDKLHLLEDWKRRLAKVKQDAAQNRENHENHEMSER